MSSAKTSSRTTDTLRVELAMSSYRYPRTFSYAHERCSDRCRPCCPSGLALPHDRPRGQFRMATHRICLHHFDAQVRERTSESLRVQVGPESANEAYSA